MWKRGWNTVLLLLFVLAIEVSTLPCYELTVVKDGPKFKTSAPNEGQSQGPISTYGTTELKANAVAIANVAGLLGNKPKCPCV